MALEGIGLNNLTAPTRHALFIILILALAGLWYGYYQTGRNDELYAARRKNEDLTEKLRQAETVRAQYDQYQRELADLEERMVSLQAIIPTEKEAADFLRTVQEMAASSDLKINLFRPAALVQRDFYFDWPVDVFVEGNYHGLGRFFEKINQATRIVNVPTVTINNIRDQTDSKWTLIANGTVTTYVQGDLSGRYATEEQEK